jgi:predicted ribosomally synthesized peptide with nif11-like leader
MSPRVEIERFARDLMSNRTLREDVRSIGTDRGEVVRQANARGYAFSMEDLDAYAMNQELSDTQLDGVSGGVDSAFLRRIAFVVSVPVPTAEDREKLWAGVFPRS